MQKTLLFLLILLFLNLGCVNDVRTSTSNKLIKKELTPLARYVDELRGHCKYDSVTNIYAIQEIEILQIDSLNKNLICYRDKKTRDIRLGELQEQELMTWKLLDAAQSGKFECTLRTTNFDNEGKEELVIQYKVREIYSSTMISHSGTTEIWNIDQLEKYFETNDYYMEAPGRNGSGKFIACNYAVEISPLKILVTSITPNQNCNANFEQEAYCLIDREVKICD